MTCTVQPGAWHLRRCPAVDCGLAALQPPPDPDTLTRAYANYATHQHKDTPPGRLGGWWARLRDAWLAVHYGYQLPADPVSGLLAAAVARLPGRRADFAATVHYLQATPGGRLLEVGCGSGRTLARLAELGWQVQGIDNDPGAVTAARRHGLSVLQGDLQHAELAAASFDAVVFAHVIEHLRNPTAALQQAHRLLRPGGRLVVLTPNFASRGRRYWKRHWRGLEAPRHLHLFTPAALRRCAVSSGFRNNRLYTTGRARDIEAASRANARAALGKPPPERLTRLALGVLDEWREARHRRQDPMTGSELLLLASRPEDSP